MVDHREIAFESAVEHSLTTSGGYEKGDPALYDRTRALHARLVLDFVQTTQPKSWQAIAAYYSGNAAEAFLLHLTKRGLEGDGPSARAASRAIEDAREARPQTHDLITKIEYIIVTPGSVVLALTHLNMARVHGSHGASHGASRWRAGHGR